GGEGWERAARTHYDFRNIEELEDEWLAKLRRTTPRKDDPATLATSAREPADPGPVEGRSRLPASPPPLLLLARWQEGILAVRTPVTSYRVKETKASGKDGGRISLVYEPVQT